MAFLNKTAFLTITKFSHCQHFHYKHFFLVQSLLRKCKDLLWAKSQPKSKCLYQFWKQSACPFVVMHVFIICYCLSNALQLLGEKADIWRKETMFVLQQMQSVFHNHWIREVSNKRVLFNTRKWKWQNSVCISILLKYIIGQSKNRSLGH